MSLPDHLLEPPDSPEFSCPECGCFARHGDECDECGHDLSGFEPGADDYEPDYDMEEDGREA